MFVDAKQLESNAQIKTDICIVGAGAAGITLARELSGKSFKVFVLVGGGADFDTAAQALYTGQQTGDRYTPIDIGRLRMFGGTTNHWAGNCSRLDPIDFEARPWIPHSGWPFGFAELEPFYAGAQRYCQIGDFPWDTPSLALRTGKSLLPFDEAKIVTGTARHSPPTRFGEEYGEELKGSENVSVCFDGHALELRAAADGARVVEVAAGVLGGGRFSIAPRFVVLAAGGIENARLLLASRQQHAAGLGNAYDLVGRFFMDHPVVEGARIVTTRPFREVYFNGGRIDDVAVAGFAKIAEPTLRREQLSNVRMPFAASPKRQVLEGLFSFDQLTRSFDRSLWPDNLWYHVGNVARDIDIVADKVARKYFTTKLFESLDQFGGYVIDAMTEQTPNPDSRVTLQSSRDAFGVPLARLDYRLQRRDRENLARCFRILAAEIGRTGLGRLSALTEVDDTGLLYDDMLSFGQHHMGTTRAHVSPRQGVVDGDLRIHGVANAYAAGSSVFATGGCVPPTLTIVALSIRLSRHLARRMEERE